MRRLMFVAAAAVAGLFGITAAMAATVVVTPSNTQGWSTADTRPGGQVSFLTDPTTPSGLGALKLTTDATTAAKAQYLHEASTPLTSVTELAYYTKRNGGPAIAAPSYQLITCLGGVVNGGCVGFTTFVYEPYQNGVVALTGWQQWDVDSGQFWSTRTYADGTCSVVAGGGGAPFYNLATLKTICPSAVVIGFGVNIGTNNPSYDVETDLFNFNGTVYDFEPFIHASDKDMCKDGGWQNVRRMDGSAFRNQGDCVSYTNTGR